MNPENLELARECEAALAVAIYEDEGEVDYDNLPHTGGYPIVENCPG